AHTRAHIHHGFLGRRNVELISTARATRFEKRVERERFRPRTRLHDPELAETRELLAAATHGIDRKPTRRETVALARTERAEIARAQEHGNLVLVLRVVQRIVGTKARESQVTPFLRRELVLTVVEVGAAIANVAHAL